MMNNCPKCDNNLIRGNGTDNLTFFWCSKCGWNSIIEGESDKDKLLNEAILEIERLQKRVNDYEVAWPINVKIIEKLSEQLRKFQWISVEDRLPEIEFDDYSIDVLVTDGELQGVVYYAYDYKTWEKESGMIIDIDKITHWMPLPAPPEKAWSDSEQEGN